MSNSAFLEHLEKQLRKLEHRRASSLSVSDWLLNPDIHITDIERYPNAKKAFEIRCSPLMEALK